MRGRALGALLLILTLPWRAWAGFDVAVTRPWLSLLTAFIGGPNLSVLPLQDWNDDGELVPARGRPLRSLPEDARIIAMDGADAEAAGLKGHHPNLRLLYHPFPLRSVPMDAVLADPSVLPFVAQRVLVALSDWDPANYPYYQRRLAEFQARLSSSVLAGQQVLRGVPVLDLSAFSGMLLQAAGCQIERPDPQQLAAWAREPGDLEARRGGGVTLVLDSGTPRALRRALKDQPGTFFVEFPPIGDYPAFLHDQYISLWQRVTLKAPAAR